MRPGSAVGRCLFLVSLIYMAALLYAPDVRAQGVGEGEPAPSPAPAEAPPDAKFPPGVRIVPNKQPKQDLDIEEPVRPSKNPSKRERNEASWDPDTKKEGKPSSPQAPSLRIFLLPTFYSYVSTSLNKQTVKVANGPEVRIPEQSSSTHHFGFSLAPLLGLGAEYIFPFNLKLGGSLSFGYAEQEISTTHFYYSSTETATRT